MKVKIYFLFLLSFGAISCSQKNTLTNTNTPIPTIEGKLLPSWIEFGENTYGNKWYIYSDVDIDSCAYIVNLKDSFSQEFINEYKSAYPFVPSYRITTLLIDTALNKYIIDKIIVYDEKSQKNHTFPIYNKSWQYFQPNSLYLSSAPIAQMLYKEAHRTSPIESNYNVNWGRGKWILIELEPELKEILGNSYNFNYNKEFIKDDIQETDSSYIFWEYNLHNEIDKRFLYAYHFSSNNVPYLTYGILQKKEGVKRKHASRTLECYCVDKFGMPIYKVEYDPNNLSFDTRDYMKIIGENHFNNRIDTMSWMKDIK